MKIDMYYDFACPFCYIGHNQLIKALKKLEVKDVVINYIPFPLNVHSYGLKTSKEVLMVKYNMSEVEAINSLKSLEQRGDSFGLNIDAFSTKMVDTTNVMAQISKLNNPTILVEKLLEEYFCNGFDFNVTDTKEIFEKYGFTYDTTLEVSELPRHPQVEAVPTYTIDGITFSGSNDVNGYIEIIKQIELKNKG